MKLKARKDKKSEQLFERLRKRIRADFNINENGGVSARATSHGEVYGLLALCVIVEGHVPQGALRSAFSEGVKVLLNEPVSLFEFVDIANRKLRAARAHKQTRFAMWSDLNLKWQSGAKHFSLKIGEATVFCGPSLPRYLSRMPADQFRRNAVFDRNEERSYIWGYAKGRGDYEAGAKIERSFSILQSLVNIQSKMRGRINILPSDFRPSNNFDHGPNYYMYDRDKRAWSEIYWIADANFEKLWRDKDQRVSPLIKALPAIRDHRDGLATSPFTDRLTDCLLNLNASWKAMTKARRATYLWMAFESLYSEKTHHCDQETIIRRATFGLVGNEKKDWADRLRFVAELRNSEVHNFGRISDTDPAHIILQFANLFAVDCYRELLTIDTKYIQNDSDFIALTELTSDRDELAKRKRLVRFAESRLG